MDTCQFKTFLHARVPRVKCPIHGVVQVTVSWAGKFSRFTLLMERLVIDVLKACETVKGACRNLDITWDQAWGVMERAVLRGKSRKKARVIERIGVDEKAFKKGQSYMTVVCDIDSGTVEYVAEDRKKSSLAGFFSDLTPEQIAGIKAIAMDMWEPYFGRPPSCWYRSRRSLEKNSSWFRSVRLGLVDGDDNRKLEANAKHFLALLDT